MPVPQTDPTTTPRRLLRDVVYDQLLDSILDGTFQHGERLYDAELVRWLGVSRTPVREALSRLAGMGLVESEPNKFTRIAPNDEVAFQDAQTMLLRLHRLAFSEDWLEHDAGRDSSLTTRVDSLRPSLDDRDPRAAKQLWTMIGRHIARSGDCASLTTIEEPLRVKVLFLSPTASSAFDWLSIDRLVDAVLSSTSSGRRPAVSGPRRVRS